MNEVIINTNEIESIWEKINICFVKMKSGKVWICEEFINDPHSMTKTRTKDVLLRFSGLISVKLNGKGKSE